MARVPLVRMPLWKSSLLIGFCFLAAVGAYPLAVRTNARGDASLMAAHWMFLICALVGVVSVPATLQLDRVRRRRRAASPQDGRRHQAAMSVWWGPLVIIAAIVAVTAHGLVAVGVLGLGAGFFGFGAIRAVALLIRYRTQSPAVDT